MKAHVLSVCARTSVSAGQCGHVAELHAHPQAMAVATLTVAGSAAAPQELTGISHWLSFTPDAKVRS